MKSVNKSKLGKSVSSNPGSKTSAGEAITEVIVNGSEKSDESIAHVDQSLHESKTKKLRGGADQSPQDYGAMIVALNKTMLSFMKQMKEQMTQQTELYKDMKKTQNVMQEKMEVMQGDIKVIKHDLHDSDGFVAQKLAPIMFDLRDPKGHLAQMLKESDERSSKERKESEARSSKERNVKEAEARIIQAIEASKDDSRQYTDKKVAENNVSLLKSAGVAVFTLGVAVVGYGEWLVHRVSGK